MPTDKVATALEMGAAAQIERSCEKTGGRFDMDHMREGLLVGDYELFVVVDNKGGLKCTVVCSPERYPSGLLVMTVFMCAGERAKDWIGFLADIEKWALEVKRCRTMEIWGGKGWARLLPDYRLTTYLFEKDLRNEENPTDDE